jgi:hypothetical protein
VIIIAMTPKQQELQYIMPRIKAVLLERKKIYSLRYLKAHKSSKK